MRTMHHDRLLQHEKISQKWVTNYITTQPPNSGDASPLSHVIYATGNVLVSSDPAPTHCASACTPIYRTAAG